MSLSTTLEIKLQELYDGFALQFPAKLKSIEDLWARVVTGDTAAAQTLHRELHTLAGSAGTFGYSQLGDGARALEGAIDALIAQGGLSRGTLAPLTPLLDRLTQAAAIPDPPVVRVPEGAPALAGDTGKPADSNLVYLVEDEAHLAQLMAHHLERFGYRVRIFGDTAAFCNAVAAQAPSAAILDIVLPEGELAGTQAAATLKTAASGQVPVVFVSVRSDFEARLHAVRAGGAAYLTKPVDLIDLINALDKLIGTKPSDPYRVLLVDDAAPEAEYFAQALRLAGMDTRAATGPADMLEHLVDFDPDLVLMDMYLPDCKGDELARVIRQINRYFSLPIVFLSAETDLDRQLDAMHLGGDEFLTKPILPAQLIRAVAARIARHRELRAMMSQDSLTGLSNHIQLHKQLEIEVARARRGKLALSFAMIDVDHFKAVNDRYGHPIGDDVLRSLSRFLRQRLRQADAVGRYGGEEFAVILADTDAPAAARVIDKLREDFAAIKHIAPDGEFCVTFSAGVAAISSVAKPAELVIAADNALYQAKRAGRNRVVVTGQ